MTVHKTRNYSLRARTRSTHVVSTEIRRTPDATKWTILRPTILLVYLAVRLRAVRVRADVCVCAARVFFYAPATSTAPAGTGSTSSVLRSAVHLPLTAISLCTTLFNVAYIIHLCVIIAQYNSGGWKPISPPLCFFSSCTRLNTK